MVAKWSGVLSTTEPRNDIGILNVRQGNKNSEVAEFQIIENNKPYDLTGLTVLFCASFGLNQVEKPASVVNAKEGKISYTFDDDAMQQVGRNKGYFSIKQAESIIDSTQEFEYRIQSSIYSRLIDAKSYIFRLNELMQLLEDFVTNSESNFSTWFDSVKEILYGVDPGGNVLRELIEARNGILGKVFPSLKARLDTFETETTAQLAQTETNITEKSISINKDFHGGIQNRKPLIVIEIDDGLVQDYNVLRPFLKSRDVPATLALPTALISDKITNQMSWSQIHELVNDYGWDVASHTHNNVRLDVNLTDEIIEKEFMESKKTLEKQGLNSDHFTYVGGINDERTRMLSRKYFKTSATTDRHPGNQILPLRSHHLSRSSLQTLTLDHLKTDIDNIVYHKGLLIIYTHGDDFENSPELQKKLSDAIAYGKSLGVEFVTRSKAIDLLGNTIETSPADNQGGLQLTKTGQIFQNGEEVNSLSPSTFALTRSGQIEGGYIVSGLKAFPKHVVLTIDAGGVQTESIGFSTFKTITESEQFCKFTRENGGVTSMSTHAGIMALDNANQTRVGVIFSRYQKSLTLNFSKIGTGYSRDMVIRGMVYY